MGHVVGADRQAPISNDVRLKKLWTFLWLNALAVGATVGLFYAVLHADFLTGAAEVCWRWLRRHQVIMVLLASAPLFAAFLVGRASVQRAKRRRLSPGELQ